MEIYRNLAGEGLSGVLMIPNIRAEDRIRLKTEISGHGLDAVDSISGDDSFSEVTKTAWEFLMIHQRSYSGLAGIQTSGNDYEKLLDYDEMFHGNTISAGSEISLGERAREPIQNGFYGAVTGAGIMRRPSESQEELYDSVDELVDIMEQAR